MVQVGEGANLGKYTIFSDIILKSPCEMMKRINSDFKYIDDRQYVHSTTMLDEFSAVISKNYFPEDDWQKANVDAQFHRKIMSNGEWLFSSDDMTLKDAVTSGEIEASFRFCDAEKSMRAIFVEDENRHVINRVASSYAINSVSLKDDFSGSCLIDCPSRKALVANIIEANKRIHLETLKQRAGNFSIINLYIRRFPLMLPNDILSTDNILLKIDNLGTRPKDDSVATLNRCSFPDIAIDPFEICFVVNSI